VRIATFNTCHGTRGAGTPVDLDALVAACRAFDADLIALEEVDRTSRRGRRADQAAVVAEALGMAHVWGRARRKAGVVSGNALLARGEIRDVEVMALRGHVRRGWRDHRSAVLATVDLEGGPVSVAVAHLSLTVVDNLPQQRSVLDALGCRPGPRLLLGDLNRRTAWVRPDVERAGFTLADDDVPSSSRTHPWIRIDHVAADGLAIEDVRIVDTGTSDHRALVAEVARLGGWSRR